MSQQGVRPPGSAMRTAGVIVFWVGTVLTILSVVLAVLAGVATARAADSINSEHTPMPDGVATVRLEVGEAREVYERTQAQNPSASCTLTRPDGSESAIEQQWDTRFETQGTAYVGLGRFEATTAGEHTVTCEGGETVLTPPVDIGGFVVAVLGIVGGVLGAVFFGATALVGAVLWFIGRSKMRNADSQGRGGYPPGPYDDRSPGYGGGQPYGSAPGQGSSGYGAPPPPQGQPGYGAPPPPPGDSGR